MKKRKNRSKAATDAPADATPDTEQPPGAEPEEMATRPYFVPPLFERAAGGADPPADVIIDAEPPPPPIGASSQASIEVSWDGPTRVGESDEIADLAARSAAAVSERESEAQGETATDTETDAELEAVDTVARLESIVESLIFASDRPLTVADLKRLVAERDGKKITTVLEALQARYADGGIQLATVAGGWQFRTHPANGPWVSKLVAGRPQRLSRALLETLAIVAYRQPITRPEMDDIRGVDCGPVLKTLLDRSLVRMIGKKEDVGRPILYGTTPEFLRTFSLKDLTELPTLREFHELSEAHMAEVAARAGDAADAGAGAAPSPAAPPSLAPPAFLPDEAEVDDGLLSELERATVAAAQAASAPAQPGGDAENNSADTDTNADAGAAAGSRSDGPEA
jgi:segregation and condensation protein B